uniref:Uncharacterized protein n=1 Tax=Toxoplasma gondii (strain ATCC 50861 / VEG) TaxID=432359 RepID=A0A0F7UUV4_TOXGV|nr:TPA: hypothetical protein BN1205_056540 [Toxoplasma gondii VEG]
MAPAVVSSVGSEYDVREHKILLLPARSAGRNRVSVTRWICGVPLVLAACLVLASPRDEISSGPSAQSGALLRDWTTAVQKAPSVLCIEAVPLTRAPAVGDGRVQEDSGNPLSESAAVVAVSEDEDASPRSELEALRATSELVRDLSDHSAFRRVGRILLALSMLVQCMSRPLTDIWRSPQPMPVGAVALAAVGVFYAGVDAWRLRETLRLSRDLAQAKRAITLRRGDISERRLKRKQLRESALRTTATFISYGNQM